MLNQLKSNIKLYDILIATKEAHVFHAKGETPDFMDFPPGCLFVVIGFEPSGYQCICFHDPEPTDNNPNMDTGNYLKWCVEPDMVEKVTHFTVAEDAGLAGIRPQGNGQYMYNTVPVNTGDRYDIVYASNLPSEDSFWVTHINGEEQENVLLYSDTLLNEFAPHTGE